LGENDCRRRERKVWRSEETRGKKWNRASSLEEERF